MKCAIFGSPNTYCAFCFQLTTGFFTRRYVDNSRKVVVWTDHFARLLEQLPQSYFRGQGVCEKIKSISTALFGGQDSSSSNLNQIVDYISASSPRFYYSFIRKNLRAHGDLNLFSYLNGNFLGNLLDSIHNLLELKV